MKEKVYKIGRGIVYALGGMAVYFGVSLLTRTLNPLRINSFEPVAKWIISEPEARNRYISSWAFFSGVGGVSGSFLEDRLPKKFQRPLMRGFFYGLLGSVAHYFFLLTTLSLLPVDPWLFLELAAPAPLFTVYPILSQGAFGGLMEVYDWAKSRHKSLEDAVR